MCALLVFCIAFVILLSKLGPNRRGDMHLTFGKGSAKVYYDDKGIPHIKADNRELAAFALGYVHAVDRLWQMEYLRHIAQGRLSEIFGEKTINVDRTLRTVGIAES